MEQSVEAAIEYLSEWPSGLRSLLTRCDELKRGVRSLRSMQSSSNSEVGESEVESDSLDIVLVPSYISAMLKRMKSLRDRGLF